LREIASAFLLTAIFFLVACQSENVKKENTTGSTISTVKFNGVEEGVTTQWVDEFPKSENLAVYSGSIAAVGNEPFVGYALDLGNSRMIRLSGDKEFISFLEKHQLNYLEVAGVLFNSDNFQYLRVLYAKNPKKGK
jgi:hypothetical protein